MTHLLGIDSIMDSLGWEQSEVKRHSDEEFNALWGGEGKQPGNSGEEMKILVGGDLHVESKQQAKKSNRLAKYAKAAALGATLLAAGGGLTAAALSLLQGSAEYEIIHRDADGNIIDVKPWTGSEP